MTGTLFRAGHYHCLSTLYAYINDIKLVKTAVLLMKMLEYIILQAGDPNATRAGGHLKATLPAAFFYAASLCGVLGKILPAAPLQSTIASGLCYWRERVPVHQGEERAVKGAERQEQWYGQPV